MYHSFSELLCIFPPAWPSDSNNTTSMPLDFSLSSCQPTIHQTVNKQIIQMKHTKDNVEIIKIVTMFMQTYNISKLEIQQ
jgi:hypothetical protein